MPIAHHHLHALGLPIARTGELNPRFVIDAIKPQTIAHHRTSVELQDVLSWGERFDVGGRVFGAEVFSLRLSGIFVERFGTGGFGGSVGLRLFRAGG